MPQVNHIPVLAEMNPVRVAAGKNTKNAVENKEIANGAMFMLQKETRKDDRQRR